MNLLSKFASVKIENTSRISEEDKNYCEQQQGAYKIALNALLTALIALKAVVINYVKMGEYDRGYINKYDDIDHMEKRIKQVKNEFISNIVNYFEKTYNVTLNSTAIEKKYDMNVTYQDIIEEIFIQLGGFNFKEKAVKEIKEASRGTVYKDDKITVNKGKLTIASYVYFRSSWSNGLELGYNDDKVIPLFNALSHFETDKTETLGYYSNIYKELREGQKNYDIFSKYELGYNKAQSIKFFKNGKVEIVFQSMQQAEAFKREYLTK